MRVIETWRAILLGFINVGLPVRNSFIATHIFEEDALVSDWLGGMSEQPIGYFLKNTFY